MKGPQKYVNGTLATAIAERYDLVQPKHAGVWCRVECENGTANFFDARGEFHRDTLAIPDGVYCELVGDFFGPPRNKNCVVIVWDCWRTGKAGENHWRPEWLELEKLGWRDRFAFAKLNVKQLGNPFEVTDNYRIADASSVWEALPEVRTNGLVYRRSKDPVDATLLVARKYSNMPGGVP